MDKKDEPQVQRRLWEQGSLRLLHATWAAINISYGLNSDEITLWAEYYSLLSNCLENIALMLQDPLDVFIIYEDDSEA